MAAAALVVVACGVENVEAKNYNQSCSKNEDCILVDQLIGSGTDCTIGCQRGAINRKDKDKYDKEFEEERGSCTSEAVPSCDTRVALCQASKCTAVALDAQDGGVSIADASTD